MSIFTTNPNPRLSGFNLSGKNNNHNNRGNRNNQQHQNKQSNNDRDAGKYPKERVDELGYYLSEFVDVFKENINNPDDRRSIISDYFEDWTEALSNYFNPRFNDIVAEMNDALDLLSTQVFATSLDGALNNGIEAFDTHWDKLVASISILLEVSSGKMKEDTIVIYAYTIIRRILKKEIDLLISSYDITEELALDLYIAIPMKPENIEHYQINSLVSKFREKMLLHAENNIDILDAKLQATLFKQFFGDYTLKCIGQALSLEPITSEDQFVTSVNNEFIQMIYSELNSNDIDQIKFVMNYLIKRKKQNPQIKRIFNITVATKFDNIKKAILLIVSEDESNSDYLQ